MKKSIRIPIVLSLAVTLLTGCSPDQDQQLEDLRSMDAQSWGIEAERGLRDANEKLYTGLNAMFEGNLDILVDLWSHSEDATQMGPFGGRLTGWKAVYEEFQRNAEMKLGGKITCEDLHVVAGNTIGYTVCVEVGQNQDASGNSIEVRHRATNIFRIENGQWKLVHHHTDIASQLIDAYTGN
jgi:ketosteroid isomerase-like protein